MPVCSVIMKLYVRVGRNFFPPPFDGGGGGGGGRGLIVPVQ